MKKIRALLFSSLLVFGVLGGCQQKEKENPVVNAVFSKEIQGIYGEHQKEEDWNYIVCKATTEGYTEAYVVSYKQEKNDYEGTVNIVKDGDSYDTKVGGEFTVDEQSCEEQQ